MVRRFGIDPRRLAIGGISMGGFGAYNLALKHPGRFCAVGGHSAALWFDGAETAPGAFDSAADFERNDVVEAVQADPDAFGETRVWNDYGRRRPVPALQRRLRRRPERPATPTSAPTHGRAATRAATGSAHWPAYQRFYLNALAIAG